MERDVTDAHTDSQTPGHSICTDVMTIYVNIKNYEFMLTNCAW